MKQDCNKHQSGNAALVEKASDSVPKPKEKSSEWLGLCGSINSSVYDKLDVSLKKVANIDVKVTKDPGCATSFVKAGLVCAEQWSGKQKSIIWSTSLLIMHQWLKLLAMPLVQRKNVGFVSSVSCLLCHIPGFDLAYAAVTRSMKQNLTNLRKFWKLLRVFLN